MSPTALQPEERKPLPAGWRWVRLGEVIVEALSGFATGERDPNGVIQLRMNNVDTRGTFAWNEYIRVPTTAAMLSKYRLVVGDVLFNNTNSTELVGKSAHFRNHAEPIVFSNHFTRLRANDKILDPAFLAAWLHHLWQDKTFESLCNRWIGQSAVNSQMLLAVVMPLPPLPEQKRIATRLNEQTEALEKARAAIRVQIDLARALPTAYLCDAFSESKKQVSAPWSPTTFGSVVRRRTEVIHPGSFSRGTLPFVGLEHIESGTGERTGRGHVDLAAMSGRKPRFYEGDIVYGYLRPYLNKVWIAEFDGLCSVDQYVFDVDEEKAFSQYLSAFLRSPHFLRHAAIGNTPGQLPRVRSEDVAGVKVPLPPLPEQRRIAARLNEQMKAAAALRQSLEAQLAEIDALPTALLRRAFSGAL